MTNSEVLELAEKLLPGVRNYLDVTWDDPTGDKKIRGIIARGIGYLNRIAGEDLEYIETLEDEKTRVVEGKAIELLYDYCRYVRSDALDAYMRNYLPELNALQIDARIGRMADNADGDADL